MLLIPIEQGMAETVTPGTRKDYVVMPININVVNGTTVDPAVIRANIDRMNEIYDCEVVIFVWNGTVNTIPDPDGTPDGNLNGNSANFKEVGRNAAKNSGGKGVSITITNQVAPNTNGVCYVGDVHSPIVVAGSNGDTWAHEMMHGFGHSHGPSREADVDMNGAAPGNGTGWDVNGDGRVDFEDQNHILWGRASDRNDTKMTLDQHNMVYVAAALTGGATPKSRPVTTPNNMSVPKQVLLVDPFSPLPLNISKISLTNDSNWLFGQIEIYGMDGGMPPESFFDVFLDSDIGGDHGDPFNDSADIRIRGTITAGGAPQGNVSFYNNSAIMWDPPAMEIPMFVRHLAPQQIHNSSQDGGDYTIDSFFDILFDFPMTPIFSDNFSDGLFNAWAVTYEGKPEIDQIIVDKSLHMTGSFNPDPRSDIWISSENLVVGEVLVIQGMNFAPNSQIELFLDSLQIESITTDAQGRFHLDHVVTDADAALHQEDLNIILFATDDSGHMDAVYLNIASSPDEGDGDNDPPAGSEPGIAGYMQIAPIALVSVILLYVKTHKKIQ